MWRSNASFGSFTFAPGAGKSKRSDLLDFEAEETEDVPGFFSGSVLLQRKESTAFHYL